MNSSPNRGGRRFLALLLVLAALGLCALSVLGLLATLEPLKGQSPWLWRAVYASMGLGGLALLVLAAVSWRSNGSRRP
ncbi:MAG: hypothetical protein HUU28_07320 [Planctomycetaceae bacterium]|nr:hypothetical protein [Planctomycetaceae bacterium]